MNLYWIAALTGLLAIVFFSRFLRQLKQKKLLGSSLQLLWTVLSVVLTTLALAISLHLYTYARLTAEQMVAEVQVQQLAKQRYNLILSVPQKTPLNFIIEGDEWQLDARVLKWHGWAQLLGLDAGYRLERISGRYRNIAQAQSQLPSMYDLNGFNDYLDLWELARSKPEWLPWVDAEYGSATYLPLQDKARYEVKMTQSGLLARPVNTDASEAVTHW